jgi:hypothetical protein
LPIGTAKTNAVDAGSHRQRFFTQPGSKAEGGASIVHLDAKLVAHEPVNGRQQ